MDTMYGQEPKNSFLTPVINGGIPKYNTYKTAITNAANVTLTLLPSTSKEQVSDISVYADNPVLIGYKDTTIALTDQVTPSEGVYHPGQRWMSLNWDRRNIDVKAATATNATVTINTSVLK